MNDRLLARLCGWFAGAATLALFLWVGYCAAGGGWPQLKRAGEFESDHFNLLSHGFLKGHLYADLAVPPAILQAANPYDPALRQVTEVLHDASYYRHHYYLYFGPAPIVTLFVPFRLLTDHDLPLPIAVWVFTLAGYLALLAIFFFGQRRYFPGTGKLALIAAPLALGPGSMLLTLIRRSHIWELSLAAGFCFFTISLWCLVRAMASRRALWWAAAGGLALGCAIASRPTYLLASVLFAWPWCMRKKIPTAVGVYGWRELCAAGVPCAAIGIALAWYNVARFGSPLEFGMTYQLSGTGELSNRHFSFAYAVFNFRMYFLAALQWTETFPFVHGALVPERPAGQAGVEYTFGLFRNLPFTWFGLVALAGLLGWRERRAAEDSPWPLIGLIGASAVLTTLIPLFFFGSCVRYLVDFAPSYLLLAAFGLLVAEARLRSWLARAALGGAALVLALITAVVAVLTVVEFYDNAGNSPLVAFRPLARALDRPFLERRARRWPDYAPLELTFTLPADRTPRREALYTVAQEAGETAVVFIDYLDTHAIRFGYREHGDERTVRTSPAMRCETGALHTLRLSVGGDYADFDGAKSPLRAEFDGFRLWNDRLVSIGVFPGAVRVAENPTAGDALRRFTGEIRTHRAIAIRDIAGQPPLGVRVRFTLVSSMAGHALPILTTGRNGAGDILFLRVRDDATLALGYDHWGRPTIKSPDVPAHFGDEVVLECWVPANAARDTEPLLVVRANGATIWRRAVPFNPASPESVVVGANPIGGTACEAVFPTAIFEYLADPPPPPEP